MSGEFEMMELKGTGVSPGIAYGNVIRMGTDTESIRRKIHSPEQEILRLHDAIGKSMGLLNDLTKEAGEKIGEEEAGIFESHLLMLQDVEFNKKIEDEIRNKKINAEWAVENIRDEYVSLFLSLKNDYMRERASDIKDIARHIIDFLKGSNELKLKVLKDNVIVAAQDLTPSDTAQMDKEKIIGILTEGGGKTSHAAIIARAQGIPAVVGIEGLMGTVTERDFIAFNGDSGEIVINPADDTLEKYRNKKVSCDTKKSQLLSLIGLHSITKDGRLIDTLANISSVSDIKALVENDAKGIGLFRSEFLFMDRNGLPSEQEQFEAYKAVAEKMSGKPVVIRTLDIGGDKAVGYLKFPKEENPFLGYRAIRLTLDLKDLFLTQLKAILRASAFGNIKIMFPMISTLEELRDAINLLEKAKGLLGNDNIPFCYKIETGIMIETPAAAVMSDLLAREADFFSIGTNDLIQYTMAVDRLNAKVSYLYSFYQPSVLRLIQRVIENGHKAGIRVGMCGEAAREPDLIPIWVGMGIDELSMNSGSILEARDKIRSLSFEETSKWVQELMDLQTENDVKMLLHHAGKTTDSIS